MPTRRTRLPDQQEPPKEWTPTQAAPDPILNNPYEEPSRHWSYVGGVPSETPGRRPASYWFKTQKIGTTQEGLFAEEERDELPLVNKLRDDVSNWRRSKYRGASKITQELFAYWFTQDRHRPLFFCQRESVETIIYLLEMAIPGRLAATGYRKFEVDSDALAKLLAGVNAFTELGAKAFYPRLIDAPVDSSSLPLRRLGCKMATGSGKTIVMAMLIAWAFCNRGRNPSSMQFPNAVLVIAPNLTVKERLQVLRPDTHDNYYDAFDLVPVKYRELLNAGKVLVTNWHAFAPKSPHKEGDTTYKVVDKGDETNDAFTLDRLGDLATRLPILVLNDEGHHCWRPNTAAQTAKLDAALNKEERERLEEDAEEARVWLAGLDRINNSGLIAAGIPSILAAVDLSATPFYLGNSGYPEGSPFPWLVSDFGLVDAIESGIVKVPRLPVKDDSAAKDEAGRPDPKYFRLWAHIKESLQPGADFVAKRPKPEALYREAEGALLTLAGQWKEKFDRDRKHLSESNPIPPVMIVVCDNTDLSQLVFENISGEKEVEVLGEDGKVVKKKIFQGSQINFPDLANSEGVKHTFRIDSKLLAKIETEGEDTMDEAAQELRELIASVGKRGGKGEQVRCVVSVSMLTEGWDASNVTHVLGIRAFGSQLLCEQVVGRGLRRMNYTPDPVTKLLPAEYVDVYGIPFSLIPYKGRTKDETPNDPVYHHIFALNERVEHQIGIPVVESYTYDIKGSGITCDVSKLEGLNIQEEPTKVYLSPQQGYRDAGAGEQDDYVEQTREQFYANVRMQQLLFRFAQDIVDDLVAHGEGKGVELLKGSLLARHTLFPEVLRIVQKYVDTKVTLAPGVDEREIALKKYATRLRERIRDGIVAAAAPKDAPLLPIINSFQPEVNTEDVSDYTARPVVALKKSHLNFAPILSDWERQAIDVFEDSEVVKSYTPNMRKLGFQIHYDYQDAICHYEPDFVIRLINGTMLILEIKGKAGELHEPDRVNAKSQAARKWVAAVNNAKRYGTWDFQICREIPALAATLQELAGALPSDHMLPFRSVRNPTDQQRFTSCVPLTTLRAAAGYWSEEQMSIEGTESIANDWIEYDTNTRFNPGMFVARVVGDSMEPLIAANSYCLFRTPVIGTRQGRKLLVWHRGVTDSDTGGQYTVKVYESEKVVTEDEWQHKRITLRPVNANYEPIELTPNEEGDVRVLAEFVEVVGAAPVVE